MKLEERATQYDVLSHLGVKSGPLGTVSCTAIISHNCESLLWRTLECVGAARRVFRSQDYEDRESIWARYNTAVSLLSMSIAHYDQSECNSSHNIFLYHVFVGYARTSMASFEQSMCMSV